MGSIGNLQNGQTFKVTKHMPEVKVPPKDISKMTPTELMKFNQEAASAQGNREIARVAETFQERHSDNGKVDILVEGNDGVAVVSGSKISLEELGQALPKYAFELKKFDENDDNFIEEHEMKTSWGERLTSAGVSVGGSTIAAAGTGATIGGLGGTAVVPGIGTVAGAGGLGLLGGAIGFVGSFIVEGGKTALYAMGDGYNTGEVFR